MLWDRPDLERLYIRLEDEYELKERGETLKRKLDTIVETARTLTDMIDANTRDTARSDDRDLDRRRNSAHHRPDYFLAALRFPAQASKRAPPLPAGPPIGKTRVGAARRSIAAWRSGRCQAWPALPPRQGYFAVKMRDEMRHAMRAHDRQGGIEAPLAEPFRFLQGARLEHGLETPIDPRFQLFSIRREKDREDVFRFEKRRRAGTMKRYKAFPRRLEDLERAQDALRIGRPQARRGCRIAAHEARVQVGGRYARRARTDFCAHLSGTWGIAESPCVRALK